MDEMDEMSNMQDDLSKTLKQDVEARRSTTIMYLSPPIKLESLQVSLSVCVGKG